MRFKLNPYIQSDYLLNAMRVLANGERQLVRYRLKPGSIYDTDDYIGQTPNIVDLVKNTHCLIDYTPAVMARLNAMGARFTTKGCASCGGKITRISLYVFQEAPCSAQN